MLDWHVGGKRPVLAGGFLRSVLNYEPVKDIDIFVDGDATTAKRAAYYLGVAKVLTIDNAVTVDAFDVPVQFIYRIKFNSPEALLDTFDFSLARAAVWSDGFAWTSTCDDTYYSDLMARRLRFHKPTDPAVAIDSVTAVARALKFARFGYTIDDDHLAELLVMASNQIGNMKDRVGVKQLLKKKESGVGEEIGGLFALDPLIPAPAQQQGRLIATPTGGNHLYRLDYTNGLTGATVTTGFRADEGGHGGTFYPYETAVGTPLFGETTGYLGDTNTTAAEQQR